MTAKPILLTTAQAREKLNTRRDQVETPRPSLEPTPPVIGATMYTCQNGDNAGKRYWALKQNDNGWQKSTFLGWIDEPAKTLKDKIDEQDLLIKKLAESVKQLKEKTMKFSEENSE